MQSARSCVSSARQTPVMATHGHHEILLRPFLFLQRWYESTSCKTSRFPALCAPRTTLVSSLRYPNTVLQNRSYPWPKPFPFHRTNIRRYPSPSQQYELTPRPSSKDTRLKPPVPSRSLSLTCAHLPFPRLRSSIEIIVRCLGLRSAHPAQS